MMTGHQLKEWAKTIDDDDDVAISEGGLTLVTKQGAWLELGGGPDLDNQEEFNEWPPELAY